jgi:release factor glutamine methyltransferase
VDRAALLAHPEQSLSAEQAARYRALVGQCAAGTPLPYLTGTRAFYDRAFHVTPAVLIPRPETEHLIDVVLAWARGRGDLRVADIGTGSGIIAVTLAAHRPGAAIWAVDVSPDALAVARHNAARYDLDQRITFLQGDLLDPLIERGIQIDVIAANLPYIARGDLEALPVARHEPHLALDGGADGLALIRRLLAQAPPVLAPGGLIGLEIGAGQGSQVGAIAAAVFATARIDVIPDYAGHDRVVRIETA